MPKILTSEERAKRWAENAKKNALRKQQRAAQGEVKKSYTIDILRRTELYEALEGASQKEGVQPGRFIRISIIEKLKREGYLNQDYTDNNRGK